MKDSDFSQAIISGSTDAVDMMLKTRDINHKYSDGNVLHWAITGSSYNSSVPVGKGDYDMTKFLLDKGADPDIKFLSVYSAIYYATNERRHDIIVLLLNYGADPNTYYIRFKEEGDSKICQCTTALVHAINNQSYLCVQALLARGAVFNNQTVKYASEIQEQLYDKRKEDSQSYQDYLNAYNIYVALKNRYNHRFEEPANSFMRENMITKKCINYFIGMEK